MSECLKTSLTHGQLKDMHVQKWNKTRQWKVEKTVRNQQFTWGDMQ